MNNKAKEKFVLFPQLVKYKFYIQYNQMIGNGFVLPYPSRSVCDLCILSYILSVHSSIHSTMFTVCVFQPNTLYWHVPIVPIGKLYPFHPKRKFFWCALHKLTNRVIALIAYNFMKINRMRIWLIPKTSTSTSIIKYNIILRLLDRVTTTQPSNFSTYISTWFEERISAWVFFGYP